MHLCPWSLASSIPVLGPESVCPRKGCPWPWPRMFLVSLALASSLVLQVTISSKDISTSHRLYTKSKSNPPPIIVRFVNRDVRNRIYNNRKNARNADFTKLSIKGVEKIFINENLTYLKKKLFWKSKQKAKEAGFKFFWTMNGNVYVRKLEDDKPILIKNEQDLDLIK